MGMITIEFRRSALLMTETDATIKLLDAISRKEYSSDTGWAVGCGPYFHIVELMDNGTFAFWVLCGQAPAYTGFNMLEKLAEISPKIAARLAEPMKEEL